MRERICIIFDFDGVIVDTNDILEECFTKLVDSLQFKKHAPRFHEFLQLCGDRIENIFSTLGIDRELIPVFLDTVEKKSRDLSAVDGMDTLVRMFKANGLYTALLTGKDKPGTVTALTNLALLDQFDIIVTADDIENCKPAPDGILYILEQLGVDREHAVMIGDANTDILAAQRAGVHNIGTSFRAAHNFTEIKPNFIARSASAIQNHVVSLFQHSTSQTGIERFIPGTLTIQAGSHTLHFLADERVLEFEGRRFPLVPLSSAKIVQAHRDARLYLCCDSYSLVNHRDRIVYLSTRKFLIRNIYSQEFDMDILIYNNDELVFPGEILNRSTGHVNGAHEIEIHQVLSGALLNIVFDENNRIYYSRCGVGDYFQSPGGYLHCSYILEGPCVVANLYTNCPWQADIRQKPYFGVYNPVSVNRDASGSVYFAMPNKTVFLDALARNKGLEPASNIFHPFDELKEKLNLFSQDTCQDIITLFRGDSLSAIIPGLTQAKDAAILSPNDTIQH